ncbi:SemiSWEET family sugar transporter [Fretibacter rubidus]|uniref:SemiSWEET family sugar transporter n=1 Tax=Fretibacter rubidus TaxID=570162 RepID=UPI00352A35E8
MTPIDLIGYAAAFLTSASFVPQAVLVIRTRRTGGISLLMYSMFVTGVALWLVYGIKQGALPLIAANSVTLALATTILFIAAQERWKRRGTLKARAPGVALTKDQNPDL